MILYRMVSVLRRFLLERCGLGQVHRCKLWSRSISSGRTSSWCWLVVDGHLLLLLHLRSSCVDFLLRLSVLFWLSLHWLHLLDWSYGLRHDGSLRTRSVHSRILFHWRSDYVVRLGLNLSSLDRLSVNCRILMREMLLHIRLFNLSNRLRLRSAHWWRMLCGARRRDVLLSRVAKTVLQRALVNRHLAVVALHWSRS